MKTNSHNIILQHIQEHGSLSDIEAIQKYGIKHPVNCIQYLREKGFNIKSQKKVIDLFGEPYTDIIYYLEESN